jgi:hypothetical protein
MYSLFEGFGIWLNLVILVLAGKNGMKGTLHWCSAFSKKSNIITFNYFESVKVSM